MAEPSPLAALLGDTLVRTKGGASVNTADALRGKTVGLYFSAHWCPPCVPACEGARGASVRSGACVRARARVVARGHCCGE
jgi:hypothetical protein